MQAINIGLLGLGTVGGGVAEVLRDNQVEITRRLGRQINITAVCDLNAERAAQLCPQAERVANPMDLVQRADVDIVNWCAIRMWILWSNCSAARALPKKRC